MLDDKDEFVTWDPLGAIAADLGITRERMLVIRDETELEMSKVIKEARTLPLPDGMRKIDQAFNDLMASKYGLVRRSWMFAEQFRTPPNG
jgi:hypothetical protein